MNTSLHKALLALVKLYGVSILNDPRRCKAYLMDCCGKQRREIFALVAAQEERIPHRLLNASANVPTNLIITQLTAALVNNRPLTPQSARIAIETWAYVLENVDDIYAIRPPIEIDEDDEPEPPPAPRQKPKTTRKTTSPQKPAVTQQANAPRQTVPSPPPPPPQTILIPTPLQLDFGNVQDWKQAAPQRIQVHHNADEVVYGKARSTLPWLHITPEGFVCQPKQILTLTASLTAAVTRLAPKSYQIKDAILIENQTQHQAIEVRIVLQRAQSRTQSRAQSVRRPATHATVKIGQSSVWETTPTKSQNAQVHTPNPTPPTTPQQPKPSPTLPSLHLNFGTVSSRANPLSEQELHFPNPTSGILTGTVRSTLPWLSINPGGFVCPPNETVRLTAKLLPAIARLRPKMYTIQDGLIVEIDGQAYPVNVQITIKK